MLTIYGCYRSRASRNLWLANELGMEVAHVPVLQTDRVKDKSAPGAQMVPASLSGNVSTTARTWSSLQGQ